MSNRAPTADGFSVHSVYEAIVYKLSPAWPQTFSVILEQRLSRQHIILRTHNGGNHPSAGTICQRNQRINIIIDPDFII